MEFERAFQELQEVAGEVGPDLVAVVYAYTGDVDAAFEWLDRVAPEQGLCNVTRDPDFDGLHDDPRWSALRERGGCSEEQFAAVSFEVRLPG